MPTTTPYKSYAPGEIQNPGTREQRKTPWTRKQMEECYEMVDINWPEAKLVTVNGIRFPVPARKRTRVPAIVRDILEQQQEQDDAVARRASGAVGGLEPIGS